MMTARSTWGASQAQALQTSCAKATAERKKYLDLMWATPIFTKKRVEYEKKANAAAKALESQLTMCNDFC